jgi:hypothetical protein
MSGADVLKELRAWRDEFARSHGYDLGAMAAALRELDGTAGARVVRGEPRQPAAVRPRAVAITPEVGGGQTSPEAGGGQSLFLVPCERVETRIKD